MKKKLLSLFLISIIAISSSAFMILKQDGVAGRTGFAGESNCNSCHSATGPVTTLSISSFPAFISGQYVPNQTYTISITVGSPTLAHFGFDCEILNGTTIASTNAGVITAISGSSQVKMNGAKTNVVHLFTAAGSGSPSSKTFMFKWVAPNSGNANVFVAGLAVNNNGSEISGDAAVATQSLGLTQDVSAGINQIEKSATIISIFPNPSNENVTLQYHLITEGLVSGTLYNLQGQKVSALFNDYQNVGLQSKTIIYPQGLAEGVYIVKLTQNGKSLSEQLLIKQ